MKFENKLPKEEQTADKKNTRSGMHPTGALVALRLNEIIKPSSTKSAWISD